MSDDKYTRVKEHRDKHKYLEKEREEGEINYREKRNINKTYKSKSITRRRANHEHKKHYSTNRTMRDSISPSRSRSRSRSHRRRNKDHKRYSRSKSPRDRRHDKESDHKHFNGKRSKDIRSRSRSHGRRHKEIDKHNIKTSEENPEFKTIETNIQTNLHIDSTNQLEQKVENSVTSPTIDNSDFTLINKQEDLSEKRREERKRKIEEMKLKFLSEENKKLSSDDNKSGNTIGDFSSSGFRENHFHMSAADTTKLLKILEEEREKILKEEIKQQNTNQFPVENNVKNQSLKRTGEKSPITDMFAETPVDEISHNKNIINLPHYDGNEDQTGYYTPKLNEILNDHYKVIGICGKGIFSNVVKVVDIKNNKEFAIKILRSIDVMLLSGEKERNLLKKFNELDKNNRSNIIRLIDTFDFKRHICLVFDLYEMNLRDLIKSKGTDVGLPLSVVRNYAQQLLFAFDLIHKYKIIHADFKPDNAVVNKSLDTIKLCDFGSALQEDEIVITSELVSRFYRPPEIFLGCLYDTKIDIWSLGCTLFELYTGKILFPGRNNNEMIKLILQTKGKFSPKILKRGQYSSLYFTDSGNFLSLEIDPYTKKEYIKEININQLPTRDLLGLLKSSKPNLSASEEKSLISFKDFLEKCLHLDANKRINALDALTHEFIGIMPAVNLYSNK